MGLWAAEVIEWGERSDWSEGGRPMGLQDCVNTVLWWVHIIRMGKTRAVQFSFSKVQSVVTFS